MTDFLLDTDTSSRLMRADRATVNAMRRSGATAIAISSVTQSELVFGARLRSDQPVIMAAVRAFLARMNVLAWDEDVAEFHAQIRANAQSQGRSAGTFDIMIAAHARAVGATLVTSDKAIGNLRIEGLAVVSWAGKG